MSTSSSQQHYDVLIVGAGVSGIGAACHIKKSKALRNKTFAILERRNDVGGTWDLFRYPGIRSDSDMYTYGYKFRPWAQTNSTNKVLASGSEIKQYISDTVQEYDVEPSIQFGTKVVSCNYSSDTARWTMKAENEMTGDTKTYTAKFLINATGCYDHDQSYRPKFPGEDKFQGDIIEPQHWPEKYSYRNKKVVVIGSGATAISLVPAMAKDAAHVTMLQRSPTYIASIRSEDATMVQLSRFLPSRIVNYIGRARYIAQQKHTWWMSKNKTDELRQFLLDRVKKQLDGASDMKHFIPKYNPWDVRLGLAPDGDFFQVIRFGEASVVTDHIETFTNKGIKLKSGQELEADVIVTATGLNHQVLGGVDLTVDGRKVEVARQMLYKSVLFQDVPNAAMIVGYSNNSWTLKVDLAMEYLTRLLTYMDKNGYDQVIAKDDDDNGNGTNQMSDETILGCLKSNSWRRAASKLPKLGTCGPWKVGNDYSQDVKALRYGPITDDALHFSKVNSEKDRCRTDCFSQALPPKLYLH